MAEPAKSRRKRKVVDEPLTLTITQVSRLLGISPTTARELAAKGELPGILPRVGGQWLCSREAVMAYLASYRPIGNGKKAAGA